VLSQGSHLGKLQLGMGILFGLGLAAFGFAPSFPVAMVTLVVVGFSSAAYGALNNTLLLGNTAPTYAGRVMSVNLLSYGLMPLATVPEAWLADHVGVQITVAGAGVSVAVIVLAVALCFPAYRRIT
jgi:hypothetical protein